MKVLIVTQTPFPKGMAACKRIKNYALGLQTAGLSCEVVVAKRTESGQVRNYSPHGIEHGIPFRYISGNTIRSKSFIVRRWHDFLALWQTLWYLKQNCNKNDIIFCFFYSIPLSIITLLASKITGSKIIQEVCELPFEQNKYSRYFFLNVLFRFFDGFIVISHGLQRVVDQYKSSNAECILIPIIVDPDEYVLSSKFSNECFSAPFLLHTGTLTEEKDGITGMLEAFCIANQKLNGILHYVLTGTVESSPQATKIKDIIKRYQMENSISFVGYLSDEQIKQYQQHCLLTIINKKDNAKNSYCFSSKLAEYLAASCPVIITNVGEALYYLNDHKTAYVVSHDDPNEIADAIISAYSNEEQRNFIASSGRTLALEVFNCYKQAERIKVFLHDIANG